MLRKRNDNQLQVGAVLSYLYSIAQIVVGLVYVPLLLNGIGQEEYGMYQFVGSIMSYLVSINSVLASGVGRFYCKYKAENNIVMMENTLAIARRIYWIASIFILVISVFAGFIVSTVYVNTFTSEQLYECFLMFVVLGFNCVVTVNNLINVAVITGHERFVFLKSAQLATVIAQPVIVILLLSFYPKALLITLIVLGTNLICAVLQRVYSKNVLKVKYTFHGFDKALIKSLAAFSGSILMVAIADQIFWKMDQIIIGYLYGPMLVAVYAVGSQIIMSFIPFGTAISSVFLPKISNLYHGERNIEAISNLFIRVGRITFYVVFGILCGFIIFGKDFIQLWVGESYIDAYYIAVIVMVPMVIDLSQNIGLTILQVENKYYFRGYVRLGIALLNAIGTFFAVQHFGILAAAVVTAISSFLGDGLIMNFYYFKKIKLNILSFWKNILRVALPTFLLSCFFFVFLLIFDGLISGWIHLIGMALIYIVLYLIIAYLFSMDNFEKDIIRSIARFNK